MYHRYFASKFNSLYWPDDYGWYQIGKNSTATNGFILSAMIFAPVRYFKNGPQGGLSPWESRFVEGYSGGGTPKCSINIREREIIVRTESSSIDGYLTIPAEVDLQQPHHYIFQYITTNSRTLLQVFIDGEYIGNFTKIIPPLDEFVIGRQNNTQAGPDGNQYRYNIYGEDVSEGTVVEDFLFKDVFNFR